MALIGVDFTEIQTVISKYDPDKTNPTEFDIGVLDHDILSYIEDSSQKFIYAGEGQPAEMNINTNKRNQLAFRFGVRSIRNLLDPKTKEPVKFDTVSVPVGRQNYNAVSDRLLKLVPPKIVNEIGAIILDENKQQESETKN